MPTRRQVLRVGLAGSAYLLGVGYVIGPGRRRRAFADDDEGEALPSPPTTPFLEELPLLRSPRRWRLFRSRRTRATA